MTEKNNIELLAKYSHYTDRELYWEILRLRDGDLWDGGMTHSCQEKYNEAETVMLLRLASHAAELERVREEEYILCAAIWYKDLESQNYLPVNCESGVVISGWRHSNVIAISNALTGKRMAEVGDYTQGFLTNKNRFVDRQEGWIIAEKAKQINDRVRGSNGTLYSEDLY